MKVLCELCGEEFDSEDFSGMVDENGSFDIQCPNGCLIFSGSLFDNCSVKKCD